MTDVDMAEFEVSAWVARSTVYLDAKDIVAWLYASAIKSEHPAAKLALTSAAEVITEGVQEGPIS